MAAPLATRTTADQLRRRACLQGLGLTALTWLGAGGVLPAFAATQGATANFAACWLDAQGVHRAGWLRLSPHGGVQVVHATELPTRGHGLALLPGGALLVAARRPGDWLLHLRPGSKPQWLWQDNDRVFSGHVTVAADGQTVFTTEIDTHSGQGLLGVRDVHTLEKRAEFKTNGLDPHAVLALTAMDLKATQTPDHAPHALTDMLFVANGGIDTAAETGRVKRHLHRMDPSVVCLHPATGALLGQWRLPDPRLSLRHLAWAWHDAGTTPAAQPKPAKAPVLGIALQAEHDDPAQRSAAPLLAVLNLTKPDTAELTAAQGQPALAGYGGDITVATVAGQAQFVVSATRGNALARFDIQGNFLGTIALAEAGALAAQTSTVWAGGQGGLGCLDAAQPNSACPVTTWQPGRVDNHWLRT